MNRFNAPFRRLFLSFSLLFFCLGIPWPQTAHAVEAGWVDLWRADLDFLSEQLEKTHPHPFHSVPADSFHLEIESLKTRLPELESNEVVTEIARIVARIGEGHTRLTLPLDPSHSFFQGHARTAPVKDPRLQFHACPVRLHFFSDGLFVRRIDSRFRKFAGARVVRIGRMDAEAAIAAVRPTVHRDNESHLRPLLPEYLSVPEILQARGVIDSVGPIAFGFRLADGSEETVALEPLLETSGVSWTDALLPGTAQPLWLRRTDEKFWFEHLEDQRAVYFQFNEVANGEKESLAAFVDRLFKVVNGGKVDKLIIDLRHNPGGNGSLNRHLLHAIIRSERLREPGSLFVLTGPRTFSAAIFLAVDLEKHTPAIFVGETTGGNPNGHGDSKRIVLPNSGLTVRVASLYWQPSDPRDTRQGIPPHLPVAMSSADYMNGRDPALEPIFSFWGDPITAETLAGAWNGQLSIDYNRVDVSLSFTRSAAGVLQGTLTSEALNMNETPLRNLTFDPPRLSFGASADPVTLAVRARAGTRRMAGFVLVSGLTLPVLLERGE